MAGEFQFPPVIQYEGLNWHLVYAPNNETTVMPNLEGSQTLSMTCDPIQIAGRNAPAFLVIVDILYPARRDPSGRLIGERRMKGFRTYDYQPANPSVVNPRDCVYYVAEPSGRGASAAQRFFDAVIGPQQRLEAQAAKTDASWCNSLSGAVNENAGTDRSQCATTDTAV